MDILRVIDPMRKTKEPNPPGEREGKDKNEVEVEKGCKQILCLPYVRGLSERIERECRAIEPEKLKLALRPLRTMSWSKWRTRSTREERCCIWEWMWRSICGRDGQNHDETNILTKRAVKRDDQDGIVVYVMNKGHTINFNWKTSETSNWRRVHEAVRVQRQPNTVNLDCGMILSNIWTLALKLCWHQHFDFYTYLAVVTCTCMCAITTNFY